MVQDRFPIRVATVVLLFLFAHSVVGEETRTQPVSPFSFSECLSAGTDFYLSFDPLSESVDQIFAAPPVPPEQAVAKGLSSTVDLVVRFRDEDGNLLLTESGNTLTLSVPRGGFRWFRISATGCPVDGDFCDLVADLSDGTSNIFLGKRERKFGRVMVTGSVACGTNSCGPGILGTTTVVGPDNSTRVQAGNYFLSIVNNTD